MNKIGILDPDGKNKNPLNNKSYSDNYLKYSKMWSNLPAYKNAEKIIHDIQKNQVILIKSETGSGKTVLLPKFAIHSIGYDKKIMIGLPKQIVTKKSAEFGALTLDVELGNEVGYQYRNSNKKHRSQNNKLLYATNGSIIMKILNDPLLKEYNLVIIDEIHERSIQIDLLLYLLKHILSKRKDFKIILMSATVDETIYKNYYKEFSFQLIELKGGTNYPIKSIYLENDLNIQKKEYLEKGIEIIKHILETTTEGDILFFVTTVSETKKVCELLNDFTDTHLCIELFSGVSNEQEKIAQDKDYYKTIYQKNRKIVIGTNVVESSLTIDNLTYVIDSGLELSILYNPKLESSIIEKKYTTKSQIKQRMGRVGRTKEGICYHLYSKKLFDSLIDYPLPDILINNLYQECFNLLSKENTVTDVKNILKQFIEPPKQKYIDRSFEILKNAHLIKKNKLNKIGKIIKNTPIDCLEAITIFYSMQYNCHKEIMIILAMINACKGQIQDFFYPDDFSLSFYKKFKHKTGDHLSLLNIYQNYDENNNNFRHTTFKKVKQFLKIFKKAYNNNLKKYKKKIPLKKNKNCILLCFAIGFNNNIATITNKNIIKYKQFQIQLNKFSYLNQNNKEKKIVFNNIIKNNNITKASIVSIIN